MTTVRLSKAPAAANLAKINQQLNNEQLGAMASANNILTELVKEGEPGNRGGKCYLGEDAHASITIDGRTYGGPGVHDRQILVQTLDYLHRTTETIIREVQQTRRQLEEFVDDFGSKIADLQKRIDSATGAANGAKTSADNAADRVSGFASGFGSALLGALAVQQSQIRDTWSDGIPIPEDGAGAEIRISWANNRLSTSVSGNPAGATLETSQDQGYWKLLPVTKYGIFKAVQSDRKISLWLSEELPQVLAVPYRYRGKVYI